MCFRNRIFALESAQHILNLQTNFQGNTKAMEFFISISALTTYNLVCCVKLPPQCDYFYETFLISDSVQYFISNHVLLRLALIHTS